MRYIFIHVCAISNYRSVFMKLLDIIKSSNLYSSIDKIYIAVLGTFSEADDLYRDEKIQVVYTNENTALYERPVLNYMREHALSHGEDHEYLYLHTKGLKFDGGNEAVNDWIDLMLYFLVTEHDTCLHLLETYDACGVNFQYEPLPHFSGNFWWTKSSHVKKLSPLQNYDLYLEPEMWLCNTKGTYVCLHQSNVDHYYIRYPRELYEGKGVVYYRIEEIEKSNDVKFYLRY